MSYTLNRGTEGDGLDNTQRGLLIGLPAIALALSFGAIHKNSAHNPAGVSPTTVPVVSTLSFGDGSSDNSSSTNNTGSNPQPAGAASSAAGVPAYTAPISTTVAPPASSGSGSGTTGGIIGGRGGGPTGGGGGTSLPDCSIDQIATVNCVVPACSPAVTLAPGQKAILGLSGACVIVN